MSDTVWISIAPGSGTNLLPLTHSFLVSEELTKHAIECRHRNDAGVSLDRSCFPEEIFGAPHAEERDYRLPDIFFAGTVWAVSKAAADVLRQFDLGGGGLYPVKVLKKDRQTPVGGEWFCLNFGNRKEAFLLSESVPMRETYVRNGEKAWRLKSVLNDGDIAVSQAANDGADIWLEPLFTDAFFMSDGLGTALKKAKADKGFFLHKCRVV
ncbi:imm11 family protein [uncultured Bradyrhizobium sp.]|uniref:imm11 family protein n=1 Tax=uncultured Bradyrhizobium sp. TaxID=199684 RepID=UPI0035CB2080